MHRSFVDSNGGQWLTWTITESEVEQIRGRVGLAEAPSLGRAWLIFLSPNGETRRLAPVPEDWATLTDGELEALAAEAKPIQRRRP